jgi:riboflavin kinase / FMN adenylyltransferase
LGSLLGACGAGGCLVLAGVLVCHCFEDLAGLRQPLHLALGVFDGMHVGHQAVIARAVAAAREDGGLAGMITFDPHPLRVLAPERAPAALLEDAAHKQRVAGALGIGLFVPLRFDSAMAAMDAGQFLDRLCAADVRTIAVGEDWRFGRGRSGDVDFLRAEGLRRGFRVEAVPAVTFAGERVSSTRIRDALRAGDLAAAKAMLGRHHAVVGTVVRGRQLGRQLGFPTANLALADVQLPPDGVWVVEVIEADGSTHRGVANLGTRPTVDGRDRVLETHLLDFDRDLYGQVLEVRFLAKLRDERRFPSLELLRGQIAADVETARVFVGD